MGRPAVLVLPMPEGLAPRLAELLRAGGDYEVVAPDLRDESWEPSTPFAAVITTRPLASFPGLVVIQLPTTFEEPVKVTVDDVTVAMKVDIDRPLDDIVGIVDQFLRAEPAPIAQ